MERKRRGGHPTDAAFWAPVDHLLELALKEDVGPGDATTEALVPEEASARGAFVARRPGVVAGLGVVARLYRRLDERVRLTPMREDGEHVGPDAPLARIEGPARPILTGERVALNLLQRMSGIATLTRAYVDEVKGTGAKICDTRKTVPGLRALDKLAVFLGGGTNHRHGLYDMILIKDNHLALMGPECPGGAVACAVARARSLRPDLPVEVEVDSLDQLSDALDEEPEYILLDNMDPDTLAEAVRRTDRLTAQRGCRRPQLEASGGITFDTAAAVAASGVDRISVGALTHAVEALDIALDLDEPSSAP